MKRVLLRGPYSEWRMPWEWVQVKLIAAAGHLLIKSACAAQRADKDENEMAPEPRWADVNGSG